MPHFYERNIVEIKNEYTTFLTNIITPLIYEGIKSIYDHSVDMHNKMQDGNKPSILKLFQLCLKDIPALNNYEIEVETTRIRDKSKCSEWFDDLVRSVIKSNIILLTFNTSADECKIVHDKYHEGIKTQDFIHKCYIECARIFYNNPELFWHKYSNLDMKRNQRDAFELIKIAIQEGIRKMLPMKMILTEYLQNDYIKDDNDISVTVSDAQYVNMKSFINKDNRHSRTDESYDDSEINGFAEIEEEKTHDVESDDYDGIDQKLEKLGRELESENISSRDTDDEMEERLKQPGYITSPKTGKQMWNPYRGKQQKHEVVPVEHVQQPAPQQKESIRKPDIDRDAYFSKYLE